MNTVLMKNKVMSRRS